MTEETNLNDVFDMAIQIERDAGAFYAAAADKATFADAGKVLHEMAVMEVEHEQIFSALKTSHQNRISGTAGKNAGNTAGNTAKKNSGHHEGISTARLLASGIKEDLASRFTGWESCEQILNLAIGFERDTIVFLVNMKQLLVDPADRSRIDELILEEMGHVIKLSSQLAKLTLPDTQDDQISPDQIMWDQAGGMS